MASQEFEDRKGRRTQPRITPLLPIPDGEGGFTHLPCEVIGDKSTSARFRIARRLAGMTIPQVVETAQNWPGDAERRELQRYEPLAEHHVETLETDSDNTPAWVFAAVAFAVGKFPHEILEIDVTTIFPDEGAV